MMSESGLTTSLQPPCWLKRINYLTLSFRYLIQSDSHFRSFLGPEVRGSIGRQLKEFQGCRADRDRDCLVCSRSRREECIYYLAFEHGGHRRKPFMLKLDPTYRNLRPHLERGDSFRFDLVLTGTAIGRASALMAAIAATRLHLGGDGCSPRLLDYGWLDGDNSFVSALSGDLQPPASGHLWSPRKTAADDSIDAVGLHFLTPTEITLKHGRTMTRPQELHFRLLLVRIMQRLKGLVEPDERLRTAAGDKRKEELLLVAAGAVRHYPESCRWLKIRLRQPGKRSCGGLTGKIDYRGDLTPFMPFMRAVEVFGLGKNLTSGFGHPLFVQQKRNT